MSNQICLRCRKPCDTTSTDSWTCTHCGQESINESADLQARIKELESEAVRDKFELSRIRPHRGDPYFYCTVEQWWEQATLNHNSSKRIAELEGQLRQVRELLAQIAAIDALLEKGEQSAPQP